MAKRSSSKKQGVQNDRVVALRSISDTLAAQIKSSTYPDTVHVKLERMVEQLQKAADLTLKLALRANKKAELTKAREERKVAAKARMQAQLKRLQERMAKLSS